MIEAMKQALEALELVLETAEKPKNEVNKAITSLRQAIAEAEKQEPVAWCGVHVNDLATDKPLIFFSKKEAMEWATQYKQGYATIRPLIFGDTHPQPKAEQTHNLNATVFVYQLKETGQIKCEYLDKAKEFEDDDALEHLATLEPRMWIEYNYAKAAQPKAEKQEPVGEIYGWHGKSQSLCRWFVPEKNLPAGTKLYVAHPEPELNPVAWGVHDQIALNKTLENHPQPKAEQELDSDGLNAAYAMGFQDGKKAQSKAEQEPVKKGLFIDLIAQHSGLADELKAMDSIPIQPKREWVGLTDEHIEQEFGFIDEMLRDYAYRIESRCKENNT